MYWGQQVKGSGRPRRFGTAWGWGVGRAADLQQVWPFTPIYPSQSQLRPEGKDPPPTPTPQGPLVAGSKSQGPSDYLDRPSLASSSPCRCTAQKRP